MAIGKIATDASFTILSYSRTDGAQRAAQQTFEASSQTSSSTSAASTSSSEGASSTDPSRGTNVDITA